jgi:hypothetical protein
VKLTGHFCLEKFHIRISEFTNDYFFGQTFCWSRKKKVWPRVQDKPKKCFYRIWMANKIVVDLAISTWYAAIVVSIRLGCVYLFTYPSRMTSRLFYKIYLIV